MKRTILLLCLLLIAAFAFATETVTLGTGDNSLSVISSTTSETRLQYKVSTFQKDKVTIDGTEWFHIRLPKEGITQEKGFPELPVLNRSIIIDNNAYMKLEVYDL